MTTNRLARATPLATGKLSAAEWAAIAREKFLPAHAAAWDKRADELGEPRIPNGLTVRFREDGSTCRVPFRA